MNEISIKDIRTIIDIIRDTTISELIIVSLFLLPLLLGIWSFFLNSLEVLNGYKITKFILILVILTIYVLGLVLIKKLEKKQEKLRRAKIHIFNRISKRGNKIGSFEYIRKEINESYDNDFLNKLIDTYPETFKKQGIKGGKDGLGIVEEEKEG